MDTNKIILIILSILLPPLAVGLADGIRTHFWINLALTICGFGILGVAHALYLVLTSQIKLTRF